MAKQETSHQLTNTLFPWEANLDDTLTLTNNSGSTWVITPRSTKVVLDSTTLSQPDQRPLIPERQGKTVIRMHLVLEINHHSLELVRWVGNDQSFYQPWEFMGLRIWLDTIDDIFEILSETHGTCRPRKKVRLAFHLANQRICPVLLHPWCPIPSPTIRIQHCYSGTDCWLGPYWGAEAHGGLDINHPAGTPIWTPFAIHNQELLASISQGDQNNLWQGWHRWPDGTSWIIQVHHFIRLHNPLDIPLEAGTLLADGAGVAIGSHEHSHFEFAIVPKGMTETDKIQLDPWILFWQMYQDRQTTMA
jgi:hypothetical protein